MKTGGYLTGWNEFPNFKPNDGEYVVIHLNHWVNSAFVSAKYHKSSYLFRGDNDVKYDEIAVDYWMRIPQVPEE